jgi:hypothetical protein
MFILKICLSVCENALREEGYSLVKARTTKVEEKQGYNGGGGAFTVARMWGKSKSIEQNASINENNCLNMSIYSYLETSGGKNSNLYLNVVHF